MSHNRTLDELASQTDSLTYLNAIKVTLTQIKDESTTQEELRSYMNESAERVKKLIKKADGQYRLFARIVNREPIIATGVVVDESIPEDFESLKKIMEEG